MATPLGVAVLKAVLLCAGRGTRLWPLTRSGPKALLPVAGRPVIHHILDRIAAAGVREVAVVTGPLLRPFEAACGDGRLWGMALRYLVQAEPRGIADALAVARDFCGGDDLLLCLGDSLSNADFGAVIRRMRAHAAAACVAVARVSDPRQYGVAVLDGQRVSSVQEKPAVPASPWALMGVYAFSSKVFDTLPTLRPSPRGELEITDAVAVLAAEAVVLAHRHRGWWHDAGTAGGLLAGQRRLFARLPVRVDGDVDGTTEVAGPVWIERGARVTGGRLVGPCYIGARADVREAVIGPNVAVGAQARITGGRLREAIVLDRAVLRLDGAGLRGVVVGQGAAVLGAEGRGRS